MSGHQRGHICSHGTSCPPSSGRCRTAARSWIYAIGADARWCRDSSYVKYVRNPEALAAFALVTTLLGRVCKPSADPAMARTSYRSYCWPAGVAALKPTPRSRQRSDSKPYRRCSASLSLPVSECLAPSPKREYSAQEPGQYRCARTAGSGRPKPAGQLLHGAAYRTADLAQWPQPATIAERDWRSRALGEPNAEYFTAR
jgi:hypothetical protein